MIGTGLTATPTASGNSWPMTSFTASQLSSSPEASLAALGVLGREVGPDQLRVHVVEGALDPVHVGVAGEHEQRRRTGGSCSRSELTNWSSIPD